MRKVIFFFTLFLFSVFVFTGIQSNIFAQATFSPKTDFAAGTAPTSSCAADFNCDGKPDLAVANLNDGTCSFYMNTTPTGGSTPTFSIPAPMAVGGGPLCVAAQDMNGDFIPDLIVTIGPNKLHVFISTTAPGASTPTFNTPDIYTAGTYPVSIATGDFNQDGVPDVAVANALSNNLSVFINVTAAGSPSSNLDGPTNFSMINTPQSVSVSDINCDGKPDIVCAIFANIATPVTVLLNTTVYGSPSTFSINNIASDASPVSISAGDINGDGKPDLALGNSGGGLVTVLMNATTVGGATPVFSVPYDFPSGLGTNPVKIVDMNNDGRPDVIAANTFDASVSVFLSITIPGSPIPDFVAPATFTTGISPARITEVDLNGDFKPDMVSTNYDAGTISIFLNTMTLGVTTPSFSSNTDFPATGIFQSVPADFNCDGRPDVAAVNPDLNTFGIFMNTTPAGGILPLFSLAANFSTDTLPAAIVALDINTDGKPDIATANDSGSVSLMINFTSPGSLTASFTLHTDMKTNKLAGIAAADLNGEGMPDIAVTNYVDDRVEVLINKTIPADTMPVFLDTVSFAVGENPGPIVIKDINNDGRPDIIVGNRDEPSISVLINKTIPGSSLPEFEDAVEFTTPSGVFSLASADFNGDGKFDLSTSNITSNTLSIFLNTTPVGDSIPSFSAPVNIITGGENITTGDFNGDGKPDLSGTVFPSDIVFIRLNQTAPGALSPAFSGRTNYTTGFGPQSVSTADINGDGQPDLLVSNLDDESFSVILNTADLPLPVELSSFSASVGNNSVSLRWTTVSEENNSGFDIERHSTGTNWQKIAFISGAGTTKIPQNYSFTDNGLNAGAYHYRLKQIDFNGNYKYYNLQSEVLVGVPGKFSLSQNYPNPFNPVTRINYELPITNYVTLKVYDVTGREVMQLVNEIQQAGYYAVNFNARSFASGTYFYRLTTDGFSDVKKMVVLK